MYQEHLVLIHVITTLIALWLLQIDFQCIFVHNLVYYGYNLKIYNNMQ